MSPLERSCSRVGSSLLALAALAQAAPEAMAVGRLESRRYIVVLDNRVDPQTVGQALVESHSSRIERYYAHALRGFAAELTDDAVADLQRNPHVVSIERDAQFHLSGQQSNAPWHLDRIDQRDLPLDGIYDWSADATGVTVFIIDSGIRTTHVAFGGRASVGIDLVGDGWNGQDCTGHGTAVASAAAGTMTGVAKNASLVSVRIANCLDLSSTSALIAAVDWITGRKLAAPSIPMVANASVSGPHSPALETAVLGSIESGVIHVTAAGNGDMDACGFMPAQIPQVLTVGATTITDQRWNLSNFGTCLDLFAPGHNMLVAVIAGDNAFAFSSGTSIAAPLVAGFAATYLERNPAATQQSVAGWVLGLATPDLVGNPGPGSPNRLLFAEVPPSMPRISLERAVTGGSDVVIRWTPVADATGYDIVSGSLDILLAQAGDFARATDGCLANDVAAQAWPDETLVDPGSGRWFLVRGVSAFGPGTYDTPGPWQAQPRDAGIETSGAACP